MRLTWSFNGFALGFALVCALLAQSIHAQGTAFTYQGRLADNGTVANGIYDLRFSILDAAMSGSLVAGPLTNRPVAVTNGIFTVTLDFGAGVFDGNARWLQIGVRTNGAAAAYTLLNPTQPLTPAPQALFAGTAGSLAGVLAATNLPANVATLDGNPVFTSTITAQQFLINTTNDGQNGVYVMQVAGSNAPSTFNFTMASTPIIGQTLPDNVFYWGWNVAPGGGTDVPGLPTLYYGIEREWYGQFETYMHYRNGDGSIAYRPFFYGIDRTNGHAQKIEKIDTWQVQAGSNHLDEVLYFNGTNYGLFETPITFYKPVTFLDNVGAARTAVTNGIIETFDNHLTPDGAGNIVVTDGTTDNTTWTFGQLKLRGISNHSQTNTLTASGAQVQNTFTLSTATDGGGLWVDNSAGAPWLVLATNSLKRMVLYSAAANSDGSQYSLRGDSGIMVAKGGSLLFGTGFGHPYVGKFSAATQNGNSTFYAAHIGGLRVTGQPAITVNTNGAGAGATAALDANANDVALVVTLNTGADLTGGTNIFTITYGLTNEVAPHIVFSPAEPDAAALYGASAVYVNTVTTSNFTFSVGSGGLAPGTTYKWGVHVLE
ncbi:MAG: hypothetical protein NTZ16_14900 [Verrucomicrobia bacterium]|nr:hypothetical protein [Verrucomicrobiota bacterium]